MMGKEEVEAAIAAVEVSISRLDSWVLLFALLVAIGVTGEAVLGVAHWIKDRQLRTLRVTQTQIHEMETAGLIRDTAEANARAKESSLALEKFKAPRSLNSKQQQKIITSMQAFSGTQFDVAATQDKEALNLVISLEDILSSAGWHEINWNGSGTISRNGRTSMGIAVEVGVSVQVELSMKAKLLPTAKALVQVLTEEGIDAREEFAWQSNSNTGVIHIVVGQKPQ